MAKQTWLMKTEPDVFSIHDLKAKKTTHWDGVRNYQARNYMRDQMKVGDRMLFYHSSTKPSGIAGEAQIIRTGYPDHTAFDPKDVHFDPKSHKENPTWYMVDVKFVRACKAVITLERLKQVPELKGMLLFRHGRLSVQPITPEQWKAIMSLEEWKK